MCGIAGIALNHNKTLPDLRERLLAMREMMVHRGPDDAGIYVSQDNRIGLANRRLSIRDLSPAGHMPMSNADGAVWITYNGEVYNTDELRPELERMGYTFRSNTDTEVILYGYEAWGKDVVKHLSGMFAFAILDLRNGPPTPQLFLARDRLGIKPLYYSQSNGMFLFASELKAMQASGLLSREISPVGLVGYLMFGSVPNPWTIYNELQALPPASTLIWQDGNIEINPYWSLPTDTIEPCNYEGAVEQARAMLEDSVRSQLVSDVPLGGFLSGGLDSSAVVALMRRATNGPIRTCSMVFEEKEYSEAPYARAMAETAGAEHYERVVTARDVVNELDHIFWAMDQPTVDGVNTYFVSETAREAGLAVALSGLGGDELFGGYPNTFQGVPQMMTALSMVKSVPAGAFIARNAIRVLPQRHRLAKFADALERPITLSSAYLTRRGLFSPTEVKALVTPDIWNEASKIFDPVQYIADRAGNSLQPGTSNVNPFSWVSRAELQTYTQSQLLRDTDVMSMVHSLEVRVPLLDHRLAEALLSLPRWVQRNGKGPKALLVDALGSLLPKIVQERVDKMGFSFPFDVWLTREILSEMMSINSLMGSDKCLGNYLQGKAVESVTDAFKYKKVHWSRAWALYSVIRWIGNQKKLQTSKSPA
jgi:asparagine synthase (glutamine-hydrolysing)